MIPQSTDWRHLAEQASNEKDPNKLTELVRELNHVLALQETSRQPRDQKE